MSIQTSLGATWSVSIAAPETYDDNATTGYPSLTYTEVAEVTSLGSIGPTFEDVTHKPLKTGETQHRKGGVDYGQLTVALADDASDAGQSLVTAGVDGANRDVVYSHKITLQDGQTIYFSGQIYSFPINLGEASTMVTSEVSVMVSSSLVRVAAP